MIIGNGIIANAFNVFNENIDIIIFASGVSNSANIDPTNFTREHHLLEQTIAQHPKKKLVYFSTCSILDPTVNKGAYVRHKLRLEALIASQSQDYLIARLSNIVGAGGNKKTLINYLINAVKNETPIELWQHAERNVLGQEDLVFLVSEIVMNQKKSQIINVATTTNLRVEQMLKAIEKHLDKKANYTLIDKGSPLPIDTSAISVHLKKIEAKKGRGILYFEKLLAKYYH